MISARPGQVVDRTHDWKVIKLESETSPPPQPTRLRLGPALKKRFRDGEEYLRGVKDVNDPAERRAVLALVLLADELDVS